MLVLRGGEQLADDPVVQIDDFVCDSGRAFDGQCNERGVAPLRLELGQIGGRHLTALAGDLEQPVLVDLTLDAGRQVERLPSFETVDVLAHVARIRFRGRLAQPAKPGGLAAFPALEQFVQALAVLARQRFRQRRMDAPVRARDGFGAYTLDDARGRQQHVLSPQAVHQRGGQHDAFVGLPR